MSIVYLWWLLLLTFLCGCGGLPAYASPGGRHDHEHDVAQNFMTNDACRTSGLGMGSWAEVTVGKMKQHHVKILNLQAAGNGHCHVLVAFEDTNVDVLSILGILEVDVLRKIP